jgi:hypothetical protein
VRPSALFLVLVLAAAASCGGPDDYPTVVTVIVESDLAVPNPVAWLGVRMTVGVASLASAPFLVTPGPIVPQSLVFSTAGSVASFNVDVQLLRADPNGDPSVPGPILVDRSLFDVGTVLGEQRMIMLPLLAKCACQGTACPAPGTPDCDSLDAPASVPLDRSAAFGEVRDFDLDTL